MKELMKQLLLFVKWTKNMNNKLINKSKKGMAIVIVLCLSAVIMILGTAYIRSYKESAPASKLQLDRIQADFFAKGIQNIAILKIKEYPDFFIRYYKQLVHYERGASIGEGRRQLDNKQIKKMGYDSGLRLKYFTNGILMNSDLPANFKSPLELDNYQTEIRLINSKDFDSEAIEITVQVLLKGKKANLYKTIVGGDFKAK